MQESHILNKSSAALQPVLPLSFFCNPSVIVDMAETWRSDGVTVASKSLRLSLGGYFGLPVAREFCPRGFEAVVELDLVCVLEGDELADVFDFRFRR